MPELRHFTLDGGVNYCDSRIVPTLAELFRTKTTNHEIKNIPDELMRDFEKLGGVREIAFIAQDLMTKELSKLPKDQTAVILFVPRFYDWTNGIYKAIREYTGNRFDGDPSFGHMGQRKRKQMLAKIREFGQHVERNIDLHDRVKFFITPGERRKGFRCTYSIYEADNLLKDNMSQLPHPPEELYVHVNVNSCTSILLKWNYEELAIPYEFLVEHRSKHIPDLTWTQQKTKETQLNINIEPGSTIEFRLAVLTCAGRSEFSEIFVFESIFEVKWRSEKLAIQKYTCPTTEDDPTPPAKTTQEDEKPILHPPTCLEVELITCDTAALVWSPSTDKLRFHYQVHYSAKEISSTGSLKIDASYIGCRLEKLEPDTTYSVSVVVISDDGQKSASSEEVVFTTKKELRFAEKIAKSCITTNSQNGIKLCTIPMTSYPQPDLCMERFVFNESGQNKMDFKMIVMIGAAGSSTTVKLLNGMINYIFDVDWQDQFRFQVIDEEENRSHRYVSLYDIHHMEGFRIPYSLKIMMFPGYQDAHELSNVLKITQTLMDGLVSSECCAVNSMISFVVDASLMSALPLYTELRIFDSTVISLIDKDLKRNVETLLKIADRKSLAEWNGVTGKLSHHKFDSSVFSCWNGKFGPEKDDGGNGVSRRYHFQSSYYREYKFNRFLWRMGMVNFQLFFSGSLPH